jgi:hypothetical protein
MAIEKRSSNKGYAPLRAWATASFDPNTGRAALSTEDRPVSVRIEGETIRPATQLTDAFAARDRRCTQNSTPVRERPFIQKRD